MNSKTFKQGDSGSAMSVINSNGQYTQIGVTSFVSSAGCESGNPDGYVRRYTDAFLNYDPLLNNIFFAFNRLAFPATCPGSAASPAWFCKHTFRMIHFNYLFEPMNVTPCNGRENKK